MENAGGKKKNREMWKKKFLPSTDKLTRAVDRKLNYFEGWPSEKVHPGPIC